MSHAPVVVTKIPHIAFRGAQYAHGDRPPPSDDPCITHDDARLG
jgi:hypothetical protein